MRQTHPVTLVTLGPKESSGAVTFVTSLEVGHKSHKNSHNSHANSHKCHRESHKF